MDDERNEELSQRPPAEGVRIIKAEEAQAALDAGQAAGRRPEDEPRFGDVPAQPSGPRPPHRFPLPDSVDPASAVRRPLVRPDDRWASGRAASTAGPPAEPAPSPNLAAAAPLSSPLAQPAGTGSGQGTETASARPPDGVGSTPEQPPDMALPEEGITLESSTGPELPHWTDPPTGEVPRILPDTDPPPEDDMSAWQALGSRGLRWRDGASDWDDLEDVSTLGGDEPRLGALDTSRTEHSDMFSFDEQFERLEEERSEQPPAIETGFDEAPPPSRQRKTRGRGGPPKRSSRRPGGPVARPPSGGGRDLQSAAAVGIGLLVLALIAYFIGPVVFMLLATVVVTASVLELYNLIQHRGFRPATLLGVCATIAVMLAAYWRGEQALPLVLVLVFVTSMLWYMLEVVEARPVVNVALTVMTFVWVGLFGSYASLLLRAPNGKKILLLPVLATVAADVVAYFAGSALGSRPLAPITSPGKTWEGTLMGGVGAIVVSVVVGRGLLHHTWTLKHAFLLGLLVAVVAPLGDLCESMVKRDLHLKDSGSMLPGHGGLLDRFDALLFVLPATYYLAQYLRLH